MGCGSADALHVLIETIKLAFADREQYYGDPALVSVPQEVLLSRSYAEKRAALIDMRSANPALRPGDARRNAGLLPETERLTPNPWGPGTVHVDVIDRAGNMVTLTQTLLSMFGARCVLPTSGILMNNGMNWFDPIPGRPNSIAPDRRGQQRQPLLLGALGVATALFVHRVARGLRLDGRLDDVRNLVIIQRRDDGQRQERHRHEWIMQLRSKET